MIKIINFSKMSLIIAATGRAMVSFLIQIGLVIVLMAVYRFVPHWEALWVPLAVLPLFLLTLGLGFMFSLLNAVMRDIGNALSMLMTFMMFLTPVLYAKPDNGLLNRITELNPLYFLVSTPRDLVLYGRLSEPHGFFWASVFSVVLFIVSLVVFHLTETRITERV